MTVPAPSKFGKRSSTGTALGAGWLARSSSARQAITARKKTANNRYRNAPDVMDLFIFKMIVRPPCLFA
jgi:hypothetical protein